MDQGMNSALQGFSDALNKYIGVGVQTQIEDQQMKKKSALELAKGKELETFKGEVDLEKDKKLKTFELAQAGKITADVAKELYPEEAEAVIKFERDNQRSMTTQEFKDVILGRRTADSQKELNREMRLDSQIMTIGTQLQNSNPIVKEAKLRGLSLEQVNQLGELVKSGNTIAASAMAARMARSMEGGGVLTDQDLTRYVQSGQLTRAAADKLSKWMKGRPSEATVEEIQAIAPVLNDVYQSKVQAEYDNVINRVHANFGKYGITKEEAARRLDIPYSGQVKGEKKEEQPKSKGNSDPLGLGI